MREGLLSATRIGGDDHDRYRVNVLWFLIGLIILAGIIYLAIWVIQTFVTPSQRS